MLKAETGLNGAEAVEKGFADTLEPELQAAACVNENKLKDYQNMPEQIKSLCAARRSSGESATAARAGTGEPEPASATTARAADD